MYIFSKKKKIDYYQKQKALSILIHIAVKCMTNSTKKKKEKKVF